MKIVVAVASDKGLMRDINEDSVVLQRDIVSEAQMVLSTEQDSPILMAVADGVGGKNAGEIASGVVAEDFLSGFSDVGSISFNDLRLQAEEWTEKTNEHLLDLSLKNETYRNMASTLAAVVLNEDVVFAMNIGDSRIYRFRDGYLRQLTEDHSVGEHLIYNALGASQSVFVDCFDISDMLLDGDALLICSDGLFDMVSESIIEDSLKQKFSPAQLVALANEAGGKDNISVIVAWIMKEDTHKT